MDDQNIGQDDPTPHVKESDEPRDAEPTQTDPVTEIPDDDEETQDAADDAEAPDDTPPVPTETINVPPDGDDQVVGGDRG